MSFCEAVCVNKTIKHNYIDTTYGIILKIYFV